MTTKDVTTAFIKRSIRSTVKEKRVFNGFDTLPYGYEDNDIPMQEYKDFRKEPITCNVCGKCFGRCSKASHEKSVFHQKALNQHLIKSN